jgi:hypothetical protein
MTPNSTSSGSYYSQHDQAVVERMKNFGGTQGLGEEIYYQDEELTGMLQDFGINIDPPKD